MASKRRNRPRRRARAAARKHPNRRLLIVCEGKVTEPTYFRGFERWMRNTTVEIEIPDEQGVPLTLVRQAEERKLRAESDAQRTGDAFLAYDEIWCVFDVDEHPNLNDASQLAAARHIELAVSNPCFELWLPLHFRESPGALHRRDLQRMLGNSLLGATSTSSSIRSCPASRMLRKEPGGWTTRPIMKASPAAILPLAFSG